MFAGAIEAQRWQGVHLAVDFSDSCFQCIEQIVWGDFAAPQPFDVLAGCCPHKLRTGFHEIASRFLASLTANITGDG